MPPQSAVSVNDELILQHLKANGYMQAAEALQAELDERQQQQQQQGRGKSAAVAAEPARSTLVELVAPASASTWARSYAELSEWVHESLDMYKPELSRVLFPVFAFCYLELVGGGQRTAASAFFDELHAEHALAHREELNLLSQAST